MSLLDPKKLRGVLKRACGIAGGQKKWGDLNGYSQSMVSMMISGRKKMPRRVLEILGFEEHRRYRRVKNEGE